MVLALRVRAIKHGNACCSASCMSCACAEAAPRTARAGTTLSREELLERVPAFGARAGTTLPRRRVSDLAHVQAPRCPGGGCLIWRARAGITLSREELERVSDLAREHGAWLVMDCTYENFLFSGAPHHCPQGPHVVHVFSFSKVCHGIHPGWSVTTLLLCKCKANIFFQGGRGTRLSRSGCHPVPLHLRSQLLQAQQCIAFFPGAPCVKQVHGRLAPVVCGQGCAVRT